MREIALHLLDIVQNSLQAEADLVEIQVLEDKRLDQLIMVISDNGRGMTREESARALDPFYTTRTTRRVGLGLSLLKVNCRASGGDLLIESEPGRGTTVKAVFGLSHIDRPPLGNLVLTMLSLVAGSPEVDFVLHHKKNGQEYCFSTREMREQLGPVPLNRPEVLEWLEAFLTEKENGLGK